MTAKSPNPGHQPSAAAPAAGAPKRWTPRRDPDLQRRLRAAGITDEPLDDIDAARAQLARRIAMFLNQHHGCPELACRRHRGCMAPSGTCTNFKEEEWPEREGDWRVEFLEIMAELKAEYPEDFA